jgi:hypothetical protein
MLLLLLLLLLLLVVVPTAAALAVAMLCCSYMPSAIHTINVSYHDLASHLQGVSRGRKVLFAPQQRPSRHSGSNCIQVHA